jgi:hypothetical protein
LGIQDFPFNKCEVFHGILYFSFSFDDILKDFNTIFLFLNQSAPSIESFGFMFDECIVILHFNLGVEVILYGFQSTSFVYDLFDGYKEYEVSHFSI